MSSTGLRQELKQFEAAFRSEHGRDPLPADIRARPDIAQKYKQYQREKAAAKSGSSQTRPQPDSSQVNPVASTSTAPAPVANPFKTPTKRKPRSQVTEAAAVQEHDPAGGVAIPGDPASPSRRLSGERTRPRAPSSQERYVVANSPSKLRALAASHSSSGSPNKRSSPALLAGLASSKPDSARPAAQPIFLGNGNAKGGAPATAAGSTSPQKRAANPFASPQKGAFGAFEREERERMRAARRAAGAKKQAERAHQRAPASGVLGKGATAPGAGWGAATVSPDAAGSSKLKKVRTPSGTSAAAMELEDEIDDFFSPGTRGRATSSARPPQDEADDDDEDDEALGPSPVKPAGKTSTSALGDGPVPVSRPFQPLLPDPPSPPSEATTRRSRSRSASRAPSTAPSALSSAGPTRPVPFLAPLPSSQQQQPSSSSAAEQPGSQSASIVPQKRSEAELDQATNASSRFHADDKPAEGPPQRDPKRKRTGRASAGKDASAPNDAPAGGVEEQGKTKVAGNGTRRRAVPEMSGEIVLELDSSSDNDPSDAVEVEAGDAEGSEMGKEREKKEKRRERIVIHDKAWMARQKAREQAERIGSTGLDGDADGDGAEGSGMGEDDDEENGGEAIDVLAGQGEGEHAADADPFFHSASLFQPTRQPAFLSDQQGPLVRQRSRSRSRTPEDDRAQAAAALAASLPSDLAALLSLRASPTKSHLSCAKERQAARVLGEPSGRRVTGKGGVAGGPAGRSGPRGLLDFASDDEENAAGVDDQEGEGDDDWDEEVDGWEGAGEAMDGYYSGDEY